MQHLAENDFDVLIIGTGIAGLSAAATFAKEKLKVAIITRESAPDHCNTYYAQGGIIYPPNQSIEQDELIEDIYKASSNTANKKAAKVLATKSRKILEDLLINKANTSFKRSSEGELLFTQEAAHSRPRIVYDGDFTGKSIELSLLNYLNQKDLFPNVHFFLAHTAIDLITPNHHGISISQRYEESQVVGAYVFDQKQNVVKKIISKKTILASGGIGALYLHHTNAEGSRGDGHAMVKRAGAQLTDMEFIQFHPTAFYTGASHRRFLISEAVRGEGAKLINSKGEAFMKKYHPDAELSPRDVVSRAILQEMIINDSDCVYLDIRHKSATFLKERFPTIYQFCLEHKIKMDQDLIPVVPAAHYTCGGVKTDLEGQTTLKNLFAVGEVACTGLHGANRLASTSLLEGLTFGVISAEKILQSIKNDSLYDASIIKDWKNGTDDIDLTLVAQDRFIIKQTMWNYLGLTRTDKRLARARALFRELQDEIQKFYKNAKLHDDIIGLRNSIEVAFLVLNASMTNHDSVGCFYREGK